MAEKITPNVSRVVLPLPKGPLRLPSPRLVGHPIPWPGRRQWAPAWFFSALQWLGKSYLDASWVPQGFSPYMAGSDVDPYEKLGSTRLFLIFWTGNGFRMTLAADVDSTAPSVGGASYPNTDAGVTQMYEDLAANPVFASVRYCYIPGVLNLDSEYDPSFRSGYDPGSGLRSVVLGSALAQAVPIDDFTKTYNQQIYDPSPRIVPVFSALVYDVTQNNALGSTTFNLPVYYARDQAPSGSYTVSKFGARRSVNGAEADCGQTVLFPGGPGYDDAAASALTLKTTATAVVDGQAHTTYTFDTASVVTIATFAPRADIGVVSLTYGASSPTAVFSSQRIIGFYRSDSWGSFLGIPIWDFGPNNGDFTSSAAALQDPVTIYDPAHSFLNGDALQTAFQMIQQAAYVISPDRLKAMLDGAIAAKDGAAGAGLAVTTAALAFDLSSTPTVPIVDELTVPVAVSVTTTPPQIAWPKRPEAARAVAGTPIGIGANAPNLIPPEPVTIQIGLSASIPREALAGTGITGLEIGTAFPQQPLGPGAAFASSPAGMVVNLTDRRAASPALAPCDLALATAGVTFTAGTYYVLSLAGPTLTVRGSDGSTVSSTPKLAGPPDPTHTFVGAMIYVPTTATVRLYPKLQLTLAAPGVGADGVQQGAAYGVRLTFGAAESQYDIVDSTRTLVASSVSVPNPAPTDGSKPQQGDVYFGTFVGGSTQMTVWSIPVFLTLVPDQLVGASFFGAMTVDAEVSGVPDYQLEITDSSLFVFSNINVDNGAIGSLSASNVFLAGAVINSAPDDATSKAFAPAKLLLGLIRRVRVGNDLQYVFVPEDDSVVIGGTRYMLSVIFLDDLKVDPNTRPYPPVFWPQARYWQFANRHNPYIDVNYEGATQADRIARAQADTARIGLATAQVQEPMQMYLDTNSEEMTVWPIYPFPFSTSSQTVDEGRLSAITSTILKILGTALPAAKSPAAPGPLDAEQIQVPAALQQPNPYTANVTPAAATSASVNTSVAAVVAEPTLTGLAVKNLSPGFIANTSVHGIDAVQSLQLQRDQEAKVGLAVTKALAPAAAVAQIQGSSGASRATTQSRSRYESIYGFSVYNPGTGEAYIVEVVEADLAIPDQLPQPTRNADYDPYYVRVVFLGSLTCYNMSIIVPSMAYDQYGHFARQGTDYTNVIGKTNELTLGYLYSLYDAENNFDSLNFSPYSAGTGFEAMELSTLSASQTAIFTNLPYATQQLSSFNPSSLFGQISTQLLTAREKTRALDPSEIIYRPPPTPPAYFVCRRENWSADCHLMQATQPPGTSVYLGFGGGDIVPLGLDASFTVDKRAPAHLYKLTYTFADRQYDSAKTVTVANTPYFVAVTTQGNVTQFMNFSINATAGTADLQITSSQPLTFPTDCYVVGQASTTLTSMDSINAALGTGLTDTGGFMALDENGSLIGQQFQLIAYNNLVYLIRAVANVGALGVLGGLGVTSALLIDTFVPATTGNLALAQGARHKRSGMQFFGSTYTPTTMVDTLDTLDFTSITGETFYAPTIVIPIAELDASKGFVADLSSFLGQAIWTFIYPEIVASPNTSVNGVTYPEGFNLDAEGKPVLSLQKLQFVYDPLAVLFTPNDLAHKYPLQPKQQVLALTNGQIQEGICWRSANVQPQRLPPANVSAQSILPSGPGMDRPNIIYSARNRPVMTSIGEGYMGMSVNSFVAVSGVAYNIEESALANDQTGSSFISMVSSGTNMLLSVLFDYDNNDLGTLAPYDPKASTKGVVFINGYLGAAGYSFSSPDHFDVDDVLPSQVSLLEQITATIGEGWDVAFYDTDVSLPQQYWSLVYDTFTAAGIPNYIANVPPPAADPTFSNRTRSLVLNLRNALRPDDLGLMDTYSSVVSANLHLQNGVTGAIFLSKKADRDIASIGSSPTGPNSFPLYGLPTKYDFFLFSRDHYWTLKGASFELIDQGYAMCLVDDGSGTGAKVASYSIDSDGNYYELYTYVLYSPDGGVIESSSFPLKVTLGAPANPGATPALPETPNNVNPQDLVAQINNASNLVYAAMGPSSPGQPPAYLPIQAVGGEVQAAPIVGAPGFNGYLLNVLGANRQPVQISQIYSGAVAYPIAGSTTTVPINPKSGKAVPFYGSISHGLDKQVAVPLLQSKDLTSYIPRPTVPPGPAAGVFGGDGLGALIGTPFSVAFQGAGAIPAAVAADPTPGTTMKPDDSVFYTFNAVTNAIMESTGKAGSASGGQYFIDATDPLNPIYGVVSLPKFTLNGNTYAINLGSTLADGTTSRYSLVVGGKSYLFGPDNAHVTADRTAFTFNPIKGGAYSVTYAAIDAPAGSEAPTPIPLTPFSVAAGGLVATVDVFNNAAGLQGMVLGVTGRTYSYDPVHAQVTIAAGAATTTAPISTGLTFTSSSGYGYVIGLEGGAYSVNGSPAYPYSASTTGAPATYPLLTAPEMFTVGGNFYTFNQDSYGNYLSVTGAGQTYPVNPYQFSINGAVYILNTNVQPNTVVGGGNVYPMSAGNTQFELNGAQFTVTLKQNSLNGATVSGQFNIAQGNVVVIENYVYQIDTLNGQIVGNGTAYPLTTSGLTYTITSADRSFSVTTEPNASTVTIGNIVYLINDTTVVGDGVTYPILAYRTFVDGAATFRIGLDGTVSVSPPLALSGAAPYVRSTFTDGVTYTVNDLAAFDGAQYHLISGAPAQFAAGGLTYTIRNDGVSIAAGPAKTYIVTASGPPSANQFSFGTKTIYVGRPGDLAAFDGEAYYAIANGEFTDTTRGLTFTISGNTAVNAGNSYEIFSNLGQGSYFQTQSGVTYYVNIAVADTGSASGDIYSVFPATGGQFTLPLKYTLAVAGTSVTVAAYTFPGGSAPAPTLTAAAGSLTGGFFTDPVTRITYTCVVDAGVVTFIDSNNAAFPYPAPGATDLFVAEVVIATGVSLAVDSEATPRVYPITGNAFIVGATTYTINLPVAYSDAAAGPYHPMINGRFIVPRAAPQSSLAYTVKGGTVVKGYVLSADDAFSADGNIVYTINAVNVVKATNQATLAGAAPTQTLTAGTLTYSLNATASLASVALPGVAYSTAAKQFTVSYNGVPVTYTVGASAVTDNRQPMNSFAATLAGSHLTFTDTVSGVTFSFDDSGNNPVTANFAYTNQFFTDSINEVTYYIDEADARVEAISYLPETTQYAFAAADGKTYLIHYSAVDVVFPVISGANVNAGVASVGSDTFEVEIDAVDPVGGAPAIPANVNSFEINGSLYTITGAPSGADYSACQVVGDAMAPKSFTSANTFRLTDPTVTYKLQLDAANLPNAVTAAFAVAPSRTLIVVNDAVYIATYSTVSTGSLVGQGQASIPIADSSFTLTNRFDSTKAKFLFADLNIFDAASVVGQFTVYLAPTFFMGGTTYTLDTVNLVVTDDSKRPFPLLANPAMFSINGVNYVIDTNRTPHAIVGSGNVSPLSTDVTVLSGHPVETSTFTLNGLIYKYTEDALQNLLTITGTKSYMIAQPALTFKLDSSLVFTITKTSPAAGNYAGTTVPIGVITAGTVTLNLYAGIPQSGNADFFTYKNVLYTLVQSAGTYVSVQKSYGVYVAAPAATQQQLAVFNLNGVTYMLSDGTTAGAAAPAGIDPGTLWAATSVSAVESQFGVVYGFTPQPINVTQSASGVFQFQVTDANGNNTLYDILYTAGGTANMVKVDVPALLPTFMQAAPFTFVTSYPLTFETGGYNAFTTFVKETASPAESFSAAYRTPVFSTDPLVDTLISSQGDFSLEFWHSLPLWTFGAYHPVLYTASTQTPLVYFIDIDFEDASSIYLQVNDMVMWAPVTPPVFSSGWRHVAVTYAQPYTILCNGAGFEVKRATNFNFTRDFSIAMTFAADDVQSEQVLLYKGIGSDITSPLLSMSYRVEIQGGAVTLTITDGSSTISPVFKGPAVLQNGQYFEVIIVKHTTTVATDSDNADPYAAPFDTTDLGPVAAGGASFNASSLPSSGGAITISNIAPPAGSATSKSGAFLNKLQSAPPQGYSVDIAVRAVNDDGTFGGWQFNTASQTVPDDSGLLVNSTGAAHLLIGSGYDDTKGQAMPLSAGNVRNVYLFNSAINREGINTSAGVVPIANATSNDLIKAGLVGCWQAQYDPNGVVNNALDPAAVAISTNTALAYLAPLRGREFEGTSLYVNGYAMPLALVTGAAPGSMTGYGAGFSLLEFNAGIYRLQEMSLWSATRQPYQIIDDMFGRLVPTNEPNLTLYLSGSFSVEGATPPILPMNKYIDNIGVTNAASLQLAFSSASLDLWGCPAVGRCGPLITPNLYTPPGAALTVCDSSPSLTTYSVTLNSVTGTLAGEINEAYVYIKNKVLTLYAGKKVGDLVLTWVSQEQGNVQLIGYVEGAPPCPMANLTNKPSYAGATSLTFTAPTSVTLKYQSGDDYSSETKWDFSDAGGFKVGLSTVISPLGVGLKADVMELDLAYGAGGSIANSTDNGTQTTASDKLDESNKYAVKMQGMLSPYTADPFMASLNALTTPSATIGNPSSKTAILPNPNLGGFTASNPPGQLPKTAPTDEKFGSRMYVPSPYGQAFVTSQTLDVYQQTLVQSNTVYGFVKIPNAQIPRDLNIVSFRISSKYLRPGCLDGVIGYTYNPATLPTGAETYTTSTGQMEVLYDKNFSQGQVGHDASYMRIVEAYQIKKRIDQQAFNALALYNSAWNNQSDPSDPSLTPGLDFYNEYIWSSRGGTQEVKHTFTTTFDEVYTLTTVSTNVANINFNVKLTCTAVTVIDAKVAWTDTEKDTLKYSYNTTGTSSFDISCAFDGIETDTQMRYASNNDAHFVMNFNSMFNPNNQSGLNLVIGSDGLVYNIVPSVQSGAGLPISDSIDDSQTYTQPQPAYAAGNADGLTGTLEPYDRPGKTSLFRTYAFFLQPTQQNADDFWSTVIDPVWLANSPDPDADAMRSAQGNISVPWRLLYRVTYSERFPPPVSAAAVVTPQITPVMAIPVLNPASDFLFTPIGRLPRPAHNPANDIEANIVLAAPTASGASAGTVAQAGANIGLPILPNNVIPFDLVKGVTTIVNWGDTANAKLLTGLLTSVLGLNTVPMSPRALPGSTKVADVVDPVSGGPLYTIYIDPNGLAVNVPTNFGVTVYQDVNGNPIQYYDGKTFHSLQSDYVATTDGTLTYYIQPPSAYDQTAFDLVGDYDLFGHPGDEWRYYLVSGMSADMTSEPTVKGAGPFLSSTGVTPYTGFSIAPSQHTTGGANQVEGYVLVKGILQWPHLNTNAETFADVMVYKAMSLLDTFPIGDPEVLISFLKAQYPGAPFVTNDDINLVFARNIVSYMNASQQARMPQ